MSHRRTLRLHTIVEPIPPVLLKRLDQPSTSRNGLGQTAYASAELYAALRTAAGDGESPELDIAVGFAWPEERRLDGKGKGKESLVIWVVQVDLDLGPNGCVLYVPHHLLPLYAAPPLPVSVLLHRPIALSTVILQRVESEDDSGEAGLSELLERLTRPSSNGLPNGYHQSQNRILREGETIDDGEIRYRILMLEPVRQGICQRDTRLVLSTTPYAPPLLATYGDDVSHRSRLSLQDFDSDAFFESSLSRHLPAVSEADGVLHSLQNGSDTSGSITPRPGAVSPVARTAQLDEPDTLDGGIRFTAIRSSGPGEGGDDICWAGIGGLGRAGIFEGDWVTLSANGDIRLVKVMSWERLDDGDDLPASPLLIPPNLHRAMCTTGASITMSPTPFGARIPSLPMARTITVARVATTEGVDKRYERSWVIGLQRHFADTCRLVRRGDTFSVPVWQGPISGEDSGYEDDCEPEPASTHLAYFQITSLSFDPLVPLEEDFRSSISSKARAGELGVWANVREGTRMVLTGVERSRIAGRRGDLTWHGTPAPPEPASSAAIQLRELLAACVAPSTANMLQMSVLIKGARGSGKTSMVRYLADELGYNVVQVDCFDIIGDTQQTLQGTLQARLDKAKSTAPSILLLHHVEALAKKSESTAAGRPPAIVKVIEDALQSLREAAKETGWPCALIGTVVDPDNVPGDLLGVFKQDITINAPNEAERRIITDQLLRDTQLALDVTSSNISSQTAALHAADLKALVNKAKSIALRRASSSCPSGDAQLAGISLTSTDISSALGDARSAYSDSIGAPKIPNVSWDDIGGLAGVKDEILETIQLPLEHPELFAGGLKKRSGILLYGPPGTGKTLLAKAVATSCSLNFFSVKGPELLNMYIGESEANVRRVFQRARDAAPCVVFMDELDSIAPKRGNQGDSGGVMDRIVSQLLAELDGMSKGDSGDVFVMGATNRPDLLDSALLRPGRFDRMVYLSPPQVRHEQISILQALTRKFNLDPALGLSDVVERCGYNLTGADFYALASDAMLGAMTRAAERVDERIRALDGEQGDWPKPLTPQYYLDRIASKEETQVWVGLEDFLSALGRLRPSVSEAEMRHYERVQGEFRGSSIG